jgi:hypothetical protein
MAVLVQRQFQAIGLTTQLLPQRLLQELVLQSLAIPSGVGQHLLAQLQDRQQILHRQV